MGVVDNTVGLTPRRSPTAAFDARRSPTRQRRDDDCSTYWHDGLAIRDSLARPGLCRALADEPGKNTKTVDFDRQIRPLLSENCFTCHGPMTSSARRPASDERTSAVGADKVIVPGKASASEFWARISATDPARQMPPRKSGKNLPPANRAIGRWIDEGQAGRRIGPFKARTPCAAVCPPLTGAVIPSITSSWPAWKKRAWPPRRSQPRL